MFFTSVLKLREMETILNNVIEVFELVYQVKKTTDIENISFLINLLLLKKISYKRNNDI
jgi:hypothetical protein